MNSAIKFTQEASAFLCMKEEKDVTSHLYKDKVDAFLGVTESEIG